MITYEVPQEVLDGIELLLDIADGNDHLCYADPKDQDNINKVGEWWAKIKTEKFCEGGKNSDASNS